MARERATVDIADSKDILRLVDDMLSTGMGVVLVRDEEPVAVLDPLPASKRRSRSRKPSTDPLDDPIMRIVGILDDGIPTDIARFKDQYIADAIDHQGE